NTEAQVRLRRGAATTNSDSAAAHAFSASDTAFVVARYTMNPATTTDDSMDMWVNPTSNFGSTTTPATSVATLTNTTGSNDLTDALSPVSPSVASFFQRSFSTEGAP